MENDKTSISFTDLVLTPDWARQPPSSPQKNYSSLKKEPKSDTKRKIKRAQPATDKSESSDRKPRNRPGEEIRKDTKVEERGRKFIPQKLPISVSFIPERHGLKSLVIRLSKSLIAYPLLEIASMFLTRPEYYDVKYEVESSTKDRDKDNSENKERILLIQCKLCEQLFLEKSVAENHILAKHFNEFFDVEEKQGEPPKGNFMCVAKCSLNGEVLCPPNYHEFNERLIELQRTKFPHMSQEEFRKTIVNDSDPGLLEQWKKDASTQQIYKLKADKKKDTVQKEFTRRSDAELFIISNYMQDLLKEGKRFVISGTVSTNLEDKALALLSRSAFEREKRSPVKIAAAIYPAFRNLGMKTFKWHGRVTYVSGVAPNPNPIEPAQTTGIIRQILEWMDANPDKTKSELLKALVPEATPESSAYVEVVTQLRWLIERGYLIEFSNGKLNLATKKTAPKNEIDNTQQTADLQEDTKDSNAANINLPD